MLFIGADHRGFNLKEEIKKYLKERGEEFEDRGNDTLDPEDDYPDFALKVAHAVAKDPKHNRGILLCGSGVGVDIVANKVKGVRSALALSAWMAEQSRKDDDTNVLSLAADLTDPATAKRIVGTWLDASFSGEQRHKRRIEKIRKIEQANSKIANGQ